MSNIKVYKPHSNTTGKKKESNVKVVVDYGKRARDSYKAVEGYYNRIKNDEFLSADDLSEYRSVLDRYISSVNYLRGNGSVKIEDDDRWDLDVKDMNDYYDSVNSFYSGFDDAEMFDIHRKYWDTHYSSHDEAEAARNSGILNPDSRLPTSARDERATDKILAPGEVGEILDQAKIDRDYHLRFFDPEEYERIKNIENAPWWQRTLATVGDVAREGVHAISKGFESTVEFVPRMGLGLMNMIAGENPTAFKSWIDEQEEKLNYDWAGNVHNMDDDTNARMSYLSDSPVGRFTQNVLKETAQGVGNMAPAIGASMATGNPALGSAIFFSNAAGGAAEEASLAGANPTMAAQYGMAIGGLETATEKLGGSVFGEATDLASTATGRWLMKHGADKFLSRGLGKAAYTYVSEGAEETIMDVITPIAKATFDIGNSREEYFGENWKEGWGDVIKGLPRTFSVGGLVGMTIEGFHSGGNAISNFSAGYADGGGFKGGVTFNKIAKEMDYISTIVKSSAAVDQSASISQAQKNKYTVAANERILESINKISESARSLSAEQRAALFEKAPILDGYLNEDGTVRAEIGEAMSVSSRALSERTPVAASDTFKYKQNDRSVKKGEAESGRVMSDRDISTKIERDLSTGKGQISDKAQRQKLAATISNIVRGEEFSRSEIKAVVENDRARAVLNSYLGTSFTSSAKAKDVRLAVAKMSGDYSPQGQARLFSAMFDMGENGTRGLMTLIGEARGVDLGNLAQAYNALYRVGVRGEHILKAKNPYISMLTPEQVGLAYTYGQMDGLLERGENKNSSEILQKVAKDAKINNNKESGDNEQGVRLRDGSERDGGQDPGGQISAVEGGTGQDQSRGEGKNRPRDREAASLTYGEEVSAKSLGIKGGLDSGKVYLIAKDSETSEMKKARARAEKRGKKVIFFAGGNLRIVQDDTVISARGYIIGDNVYVRVDHPYYTADQLMRHELGHDMIARGEVNVDEVRERINDRFEDVDFIVERYTEAYEGSGLDADEIWEEIICDSLGNMNIFAPVEVLGEMNDEFLEVLKEETRKSQKDARGPPRGGAKFSISPTLESELDTVLNGTFDASKNEVYLGETSNFMTDVIGAEALSLYMPASKAYSSLITEEEYNKKPYYSKQDNYHGIGKDRFIEILEKSEEPIVAFAAALDEDGNKRRNRIVLVTDVKIWDVEHKHLDYAVVIEEVDTKARVNGKRIDANKTISIYPRSQLIQDILMALSDHRLLDITKKGEHLFAGGRGSNPQAAIRKDVLEKNIAHFWANVKWEKQNNTTFSTKETEMPSAFQIALEKAGYFDQDGHSKYMQENDDLSHKKDKSSGKSSQDLDFVDFLNENIEERERSNREILANLLETEDMSPSEKGFLTKYKNKIAQIEANEAEISSMEAELKELRKAGKKDSARAITLEGKIEARRKEIARDENMILNLESTNSIKRLLKREKDAAYAEGILAGQMAQGRQDAAKLRESEEKLAEQKRKDGETLAEYKKRVAEREAEIKQKNREKLAEQKRQAQQDVEDAHLAGRMAQGRIDAAKLATAKRTLDEQAKRYQESRKKATEGRHKTAMRHKIAGVVSELDKLLRKGTKERNVKIGLQDAVASALELFDMNSEKVERYNKAIADLDARIAATTDPVEIEALTALREKKVRNSERLADKLQVMKKAYEDIHNGRDGENYPSYYKAECEAIENRIAEVMEKVGDTPIGDMSLEQLELVYDMYRMVLTTVQNVNMVVKNGKLADLTADAADMTSELQRIKKLAEERLKAGDDIRSFVWNELTPYYAFNRIGSDTLMSYYHELIRGQDVYARDIEEAQIFAEDTRKKHGYSKWKLDQVHSFKDKDGRDFRLTLRHMMSIYAYSKREQAFDHMEKGGFFFNNKETFRTDKTGILKFVASNESGYKVDARVFAQIKGALTAEQIAYVDEMQAYLTKMGEKGNEVTRVMWGIDIFTEDVYFPLKSKEDFIYQANTPAETSSLKNDGMTKETKPHASNPIVLESFDDVWANHVEKMSKYHGFVIPIDNLNKLINYGTWMDGDSQAISTMLEARFGPGVNEYLNTFIKDLNGAKAQSGGIMGGVFNLLSKFKKTSVAASLSVVVQQPTAIIRALSEIDARYFVGMPKPEILNRKWERMKKYAPIVILKDIGGFDAGSGRQITEWLNADTKRGVDRAMNKADDLTMYGAALGDRIGWASIWTAVEREVKAKQKLEYGSEAFYEAVGKRFTEVIVKTQVYDSTLSRSGFMRGKDGLMKMATAFMGEPTLSVNMMADAILQAKRGKIKKAKAVRVIASVYVATVAASVIKSLIYALRDDDEDESYAEKYLQALGSNIIWDTLALNMIPFVRDAVSIFTGWEIERADMALIQDLYDSYKSLGSETKDPWRKVEDFVGALAAFVGIPAKNLIRTGREIRNAVINITDGIEGGDLGGAFIEGITGKEAGKRESMYNALISGDPERIEIYRDSYDSEDKYLSAVKQVLREYDPRVQRAVEGALSGSYSLYNEMKDAVKAEKHFDVKTVNNAFADEKEYVLGKLNDARKARRDGNSEEFDKIVQKLIERGYSEEFVRKKLK